MRKNILVSVIIFSAMLAVVQPVFSAEETVKFGNKICPVSEEGLMEGETIEYEYNGVVYNLCCKMCLKDFKKDPEKYIAKLQAQREAEEEKEAHSDTHKHHHH